jgi:hypothetical protein
MKVGTAPHTNTFGLGDIAPTQRILERKHSVPILLRRLDVPRMARNSSRFAPYRQGATDSHCLFKRESYVPNRGPFIVGAPRCERHCSDDAHYHRTSNDQAAINPFHRTFLPKIHFRVACQRDASRTLATAAPPGTAAPGFLRDSFGMSCCQEPVSRFPFLGDQRPWAPTILENSIALRLTNVRAFPCFGQARISTRCRCSVAN